MATSLPPEEHASYTAIIDAILASADLETISAKAIRKDLQEEVGYDLTSMKKPITDLIMQRFDKVQRERESTVVASTNATSAHPITNGVSHVPSTNGTTHTKADGSHPAEHKVKGETRDNNEDEPSPPPKKRKTSSSSNDDNDQDQDSLSDVKDTPPPKKVRKTTPSTKTESDEQMAKRLQAEFSAPRSRATRGGANSTTSSAKKKSAKSSTIKKPKKKSAAKINSDDDSDLESSTNHKGSDQQKEKKTGFHKPLHLSEPLQALLGEAQLSRPETVKRIWAYVKERDLQDPNDKRQIRCDDAMRRVFKSEKVHMFTMNKVLATQLWPVEEVVE